jgi:hypothetical protein
MSLFLLVLFLCFLCFVGGFLACCWLDSTDVIPPDFCDVCSFDHALTHITRGFE